MEQLQSDARVRAKPVVVVALALSMLLASLGTSIANIALPALAETFSAPFAQVQWVVIAYLAAMTASVVIAGWLGDRYGLKRMQLLGLFLFGSAALLCGFAPGLWLLVGARLLQGIGAAFLMTLSMALMRENAGRTQMGSAMGLLGTVSAIGTALGPSLGGLLIPLAGWQGVFLVQVPLAALALALILIALPTPSRRSPAAPGWHGTKSDWALLPNLLTNALVAAVMMTTLVVGPFYLHLGLGLMAATVGLIMSIGPVISIFSGIPSGRLVDRWGPSRMLMIGLGLMAAGALLMALLPQSMGAVGYGLAILVLTPGYQLFQAANNTAALADVPSDRRGRVSGLLGLSRNIGLIAGASAMGAVFAFGVASPDFTQATPAAMADGLRLTFLLATVLMLLAIAITRRSRPPAFR